jgi:hypothetical protein
MRNSSACVKSVNIEEPTKHGGSVATYLDGKRHASFLHARGLGRQIEAFFQVLLCGVDEVGGSDQCKEMFDEVLGTAIFRFDSAGDALEVVAREEVSSRLAAFQKVLQGVVAVSHQRPAFLGHELDVLRILEALLVLVLG